MNIILKPLTAFVTLNDNDSASIVIKNDENDMVLGPLTHHMLSLQANWKESINDHIRQLKNRGMNIVSLDTDIEGVHL